MKELRIEKRQRNKMACAVPSRLCFTAQQFEMHFLGIPSPIFCNFCTYRIVVVLVNHIRLIFS